MRRIKVSTPQSNTPKIIESDATTWGELKDELLGEGIDASGMKGVVKESRNSLEASAAELPVDDFTLFLFPNKVKSGLNIPLFLSEFQDKLDTVINELRDEFESGSYNTDEDNDEEDDIRKELEEEIGF